MNRTVRIVLILAAMSLIAVMLAPSIGIAAGPQFSSKERVGHMIFNDTNLSTPPGQSCASCHHPSAGFADPDSNLPVSEGAIKGRFGNRNSPTAAYAA